MSFKEDEMYDYFDQIFKRLQCEFQERKKEGKIPKPVFPGEELLKELSDKILYLTLVWDFMDIDILFRDSFRFGQSSKEDATTETFIVDISKGLKAKNKRDDAISLLQFLLRVNPNCFIGLTALEELLSTNVEDEEGYRKLLQEIIKVCKNKEDTRKYEFKLKDRTGPAESLSHATTIVFYKQYNKLQLLYPTAYLLCVPEEGQVCVIFKENIIHLPPNQPVIEGEYTITIISIGLLYPYAKN